MASNMYGLSGITSAANSLGNLILVSPQTNIGYYAQGAPVPAGVPVPKQNQTGFLFDYEGENTLSLEADITDHYVENNSTISDQIAIKPETVTVQGFVAELSDILPEVNNLVNIIQSKLTTLSPYTPIASETALKLLNDAILAVEAAASVASSVQQSIAWASGKEFLNKQQKAFKTFNDAFKARTLFTIQTPWAVFDNMAIKSLRATQSPDTRMITDFEITFKKIYYVSEESAALEAQERSAQQTSIEKNGGSASLNYASPKYGQIIKEME